MQATNEGSVGEVEGIEESPAYIHEILSEGIAIETQEWVEQIAYLRRRP